jgi:peptidylprolyl isomerase
VRRLAVILTLLVVTCAGTFAGATATAAASTASPLGKITVEGTAGEKPTLKFTAPFAVTKTVDSELAIGTGNKLAQNQKITFDFVVVDGRTGKEIGTSYGAAPAFAVLDKTQVAPGIVNGLVGASVGSRVLIAIAPKDGLAKGITGNGVKKNDTLLFLVDVKSIRTPLARATGAAVTPPAGLPTVALDGSGKPTITVPPAGTAAPTGLVVQPLELGTGPAVASGQTITVHYTGVIWATGKQFDSSWDRGKSIDFSIGAGKVIKGWDQALVGQTVGSQLLLVVPPDLGYGTTGNTSAGISGTDSLVFVVDILDAF